MAIDPKELRIGSHVEYEDRRCIVVGIADIMSALKGDVALKCDDEIMLNADLNLINPILITPELLTEFGLLKMEEHGNVSVWMNRNIRIDIIGERITAMVGNDYNKCTIKPIYFLHELETFLYLTTKQELIND